MDEQTRMRTLSDPYCQFYSGHDMADLFGVSYDEVIRTKRFNDLRANWTLKTQIRRFPREKVNIALREEGREVPVEATSPISPEEAYPNRWIRVEAEDRLAPNRLTTSDLCQITGLGRELLLREFRAGAFTNSGKVWGEYVFDYDEVTNAFGLSGLFYWGAEGSAQKRFIANDDVLRGAVEMARGMQASFDGHSTAIVSGVELAGIVQGMMRTELKPLVEQIVREELARHRLHVVGEFQRTFDVARAEE